MFLGFVRLGAFIHPFGYPDVRFPANSQSRVSSFYCDWYDIFHSHPWYPGDEPEWLWWRPESSCCLINVWTNCQFVQHIILWPNTCKTNLKLQALMLSVVSAELMEIQVWHYIDQTDQGGTSLVDWHNKARKYVEGCFFLSTILNIKIVTWRNCHKHWALTDKLFPTFNYRRRCSLLMTKRQSMMD